MQRQKTRPLGERGGNPTGNVLLFQPPRDRNLDFISGALSHVAETTAEQARRSRHTVHGMNRVLQSATIVRKRADVLDENCRGH